MTIILIALSLSIYFILNILICTNLIFKNKGKFYIYYTLVKVSLFGLIYCLISSLFLVIDKYFSVKISLFEEVDVFIENMFKKE